VSSSRMQRPFVTWFALVLAVLPAAPAAADLTLSDKVTSATEVYRELLQTPDRGVPEALLEKCRCVGVFPNVYKGAFGIGARIGQGIVSCRSAEGWSPIGFFRMTGGSFGFQIGAEAADVVLFFMSESGARSLLESKFTLGGKASIAAGPVGRSAEATTDLKLDAEIYSYAKSKGLFAGISFEGARLAPDTKANRSYYGEEITAEELLFQRKAPRNPAEAQTFRAALP
jgi:SH3 domain-containing YSC84-like protein 1